NISFKKDLLEQIDQVAKEESRTRSELIREAARSYIERKRIWKKIFVFGENQAEKKKFTEVDIIDEITIERKLKRKYS
ncbi:hypothetical protein LCGC14_3054490, partial [marine sediment metagenome]